MRRSRSKRCIGVHCFCVLTSRRRTQVDRPRHRARSTRKGARFLPRVQPLFFSRLVANLPIQHPHPTLGACRRHSRASQPGVGTHACGRAWGARFGCAHFMGCVGAWDRCEVDRTSNFLCFGGENFGFGIETRARATGDGTRWHACVRSPGAPTARVCSQNGVLVRVVQVRGRPGVGELPFSIWKICSVDVDMRESAQTIFGFYLVDIPDSNQVSGEPPTIRT